MKLDTKELKTITLLYVEDDEIIRKQTSILFEKIFKKLYLAEDGQRGLEVFIENKDDIDVVVTDINMPNLNGIDMIAKIDQEGDFLIPTIVTTAHTDAKNLLDAIDKHVDKYITKPIQIKELTISIVNLVAQYRKSNRLESLAKGLVKKSNSDDKINKEMGNLLKIKSRENKFYKSIIEDFVAKFNTDKNGTIIEVTEKFNRLFNYHRDDIIGQNINILKCTSCSQESFQKLMLKAIHSKKTITSTHTFTTNDNKSIVCDVNMTPNYGSDSLVSGYTFYLDLVS